MKISHEVPSYLLDESVYFNDYDYFLIHLIVKDQNYQDFYKKSKKLNRHIILDNSACELRGKEEFDFDEFANWIEKLKPDEYLIPDVFNDFDKNMEYFEKWISLYKDLPGTPIATLHGTSIEQFESAYYTFKWKCPKAKIAFNFDESVYTQYDMCPENKSMNKMLNRISLIYNLLYRGVIDTNRKHHLLGCHLPQEFKAYKGMNWIESIDTSNPVMAALEEKKYSVNGLIDKPKMNIDTSQTLEYDDVKKECLIHNLKMFRSFCF